MICPGTGQTLYHIKLEARMPGISRDIRPSSCIVGTDGKTIPGEFKNLSSLISYPVTVQAQNSLKES